MLLPLCACSSGDPFDWYHSYVVIRDLIRDFVKLSDNILILGCGNSRKSTMCTSVANQWTSVLIDMYAVAMVLLCGGRSGRGYGLRR
jgi:hypothetical protein